MITTDFYGKNLSSSFNSAIVAVAQKVKPKILVTWLDSRHLDNLTITTNDDYSNTSYPSRGFFFNSSQAFNGWERQSFTWAVAGAKDKNGDVIKSDGSWYALPSLVGSDLSESQLSGSLEFGWWSNSVSNSNVHATYNGYGFSTDPYVEATFDTRKVNKVRIVTSEFYGQIYDYELKLYAANSAIVLTENGTITSNTYYQDHFVSSELATQNIAKIRVTVRSTKNPSDYARIQEIIPMYQVDMSDYVMNYSVSKTRDVHVTSLPIGGNQSNSLDITFDNTEKIFNLYNTSSTYGQYMKKDLKIEAYTGWRIKKPGFDYLDNVYLFTNLNANANSSTTTMTVSDKTIFPTGGEDNYFVAIIDRNTQSEEYLLCSGTSGTNTLNIVQRGYGGTVAKTHTSGSIVEFELYEYVHNGTYYVDEWKSSSNDMQTSASCQDWTKFISEHVIDYGFFLQNALVGEAVENLLLRGNFPKSNIKKLSKYDKGAIEKGAIAAYSFAEETVDRTGNDIISSTGLRARFWGMPSNKRDISVKDIVADAIDKDLSPLQKALGETKFITQSFTALSKSISTNSTSALELNNYSFTGVNGTTYSDYYNGVIDGYYIPTTSGSQTLVLNIQSGGARLYLDDIVVLDKYHLHTTNTRIESSTLNLSCGVPRKIRIEFWHSYNNSGSPSFVLKLKKSVGGGGDTLVAASECCTIAAFDYVGSKNPSENLDTADAFNNRNTGIYIAAPKLNQLSGLISNTEDKSVLLESNAYIRIPYHSSLDLTNSNSDLYTGKWSIEFYGKFNNGSFNNTGEYLSSWSNATPTSGFELYNNSNSNGIKIITSSGTETVSSNIALSNSQFSHIMTTYDGTTLSYYVNGSLENSANLAGSPVAWANSDFTIGGRGASFSNGAGENAPLSIRSFIVDELAFYNNCLTSAEVQDRYSESQIQPLTTFAFLYANKKSIQEAMNDVTFADLGRLYIDEYEIARYEHYFRFFESSIDQHANVQATLSDNTNIISADFSVQLQCNKVTVPIANLQKSTESIQALWRANANSSLRCTVLTSNITANANVAYVSSTVNPPWPENGYVKIDNEIIKYLTKTAVSFNNLERAQFQTTAASHNSNTKVRETRYYDLKFEKTPAFNIRSPFITAIEIEEPDLVEIYKFIPNAYGAELIVNASNNLSSGEIVLLEGTNPLTKYNYNFSIAGAAVVISEQEVQLKKQSATNSESIKKYGLKDVEIQSEFISDAEHAKRLANFIIDKTKLPVPILNVSIAAMPTLQMGDRIRISNMSSIGIVNTDYWVISQNMSFGDSISHSLVLRQVS